MKKLLLLLFLFPQSGLTQSAILQQYIQQGIEGNLALKQQNLEIEKAFKAIEEARSNLFPKVAFAPTYTLAAGGRKIDFPIGDLLNPVYGTLNQLTASNSFPEIQNEQIQFLPNNFQETKVNFQLPLFNSDIKYNIELKKEMVKTESAKKKLLTYELKYQIEAAYYQYLQSLEAVKIYEQSSSFLHDYLAFNQRLVDNDVVLKDVVYSAEYELSKLEAEIAVAKKNVNVAKAYFNFLINRESNAPVEGDPAIFTQKPLLSELDYYQNEALKNRPEFDQLQAGQEVTNTLLKMQEKSAVLPSLFVGGNVGFQGFGYTFKNQGYALGQFGLNWDLYHGKEKKIKIQQTRIQQHILVTKEEEVVSQIKLQVARAYYEIQGALQKMESVNKGIKCTDQLLQLVEKKYKNNNALYIEVIKAQNDRKLAQLSASISAYELWLKKAELDKASGL